MLFINSAGDEAVIDGMKKFAMFTDKARSVRNIFLNIPFEMYVVLPVELHWRTEITRSQ